MKLASRGKRFFQPIIQNDTQQILQDLQQSLIQQTFPTDIGINQFQKLYQKKRILSDTIDQYKQKNKYYKNDIQRAQQRIYQISQLNNKANKQSILMRNQINKINDAHMMSKILMMEKIIKLGQENQNLQKKRIKCYEIKQQKQRVNSISQSLFEKKQRNRELSVQESKAMQSYLNDINYQTIEDNKSRADKIRSQKQRRKARLMRYQKFKQQQAQKNYLNKTQTLRKNLQDKEKLLETLFVQEQKQLRHYQTTQHVTKQYLENMYQTAANSRLIIANGDTGGSLFPTQTI